jgi:hypothetical protein
MALVPAGAFPGAVVTDIAGVLLGFGLIAVELYRPATAPEPGQ